MQNYNQIHGDPIDISNEGNLVGTGVLVSDFFDTTAGVPTVTLTELIGVTIVAMFRENAPYQEVTALTTGRQFLFDDTTGLLTFPTDFNPSEQLFIFYYTGTAPVTYTEPVTVAEMKNYLRLQGFIDEGQSISDFESDDTLIEELITSAREMIERHNGISIVSKALRVTITNLAGGQIIPWGPVNAIASIKNSAGTEITTDNYTITARDEITCPRDCRMVIEYYAGYTNVPKALKIAVMKQVAWDYEHRGTEQDFELCAAAIYQSRNYNRTPWLT